MLLTQKLLLAQKLLSAINLLLAQKFLLAQKKCCWHKNAAGNRLMLAQIFLITGLRSSVGNVPGYRCVSGCRSRCQEFYPDLDSYFRGDWSWNNFYGHSPLHRWIIQEGLSTVFKRKYLHEVLVNRLFKFAQEKVWLGDRPAMTIAVDLGRKATKRTNKILRWNECQDSQTRSSQWGFWSFLSSSSSSVKCLATFSQGLSRYAWQRLDGALRSYTDACKFPPSLPRPVGTSHD